MLHRFFLTTLYLLVGITLLGQQEFGGTWTGVITQENKSEGFFYQLDLLQNGVEVAGKAYSKTADETKTGIFEVAGIIENNQLVLQEIVQVAPENETWCMKHLRLTLSDNQSSILLGGNWTADGCTPGKVRLQQTKKPTPSPSPISTSTIDLTGNWAGSLSQSDRDYGFYFEMNFPDASNKATSYIVAEGNGGGCQHALTYTLNENNFQFSETTILKKDDPNWKWCIKSGQLTYRKESDKHILEGNWSGFIEGLDMASGACASGTVYLEKPILGEAIELGSTNMSVYEVNQERTVKIARTLKVASPNLKVRVWDNGIVDGDILTLFLNGNMLFDHHKVTKNKRAVNVELIEDTNLLILHAEDLGDIKPNTVAVSIDDGIKEQILILSSNLRESGAVMIKQFEMEGN